MLFGEGRDNIVKSNEGGVEVWFGHDTTALGLHDAMRPNEDKWVGGKDGHEKRGE